MLREVTAFVDGAPQHDDMTMILLKVEELPQAPAGETITAESRSSSQRYKMIVVTDLVTVFQTRSDVEASVVRGLLEAHGVPSVITSHLPQSLFPMAVSTLGEIGIAVHADDADEARAHYREPPHGTGERSGLSGCATSSRPCSRRLAIASATAGCSSTP